jgi:hypothetical protein
MSRPFSTIARSSLFDFGSTLARLRGFGAQKIIFVT